MQFSAGTCIEPYSHAEQAIDSKPRPAKNLNHDLNLNRCCRGRIHMVVALPRDMSLTLLVDRETAPRDRGADKHRVIVHDRQILEVLFSFDIQLLCWDTISGSCNFRPSGGKSYQTSGKLAVNCQRAVCCVRWLWDEQIPGLWPSKNPLCVNKHSVGKKTAWRPETQIYLYGSLLLLFAARNPLQIVGQKKRGKNQPQGGHHRPPPTTTRLPPSFSLLVPLRSTSASLCFYFC